MSCAALADGDSSELDDEQVGLSAKPASLLSFAE
jgi:hypothetical protein